MCVGGGGVCVCITTGKRGIPHYGREGEPNTEGEVPDLLGQNR